MLRAISGKSPFAEMASDRASLASAAQAVWIDLVEPSEHERAEIAHLTGLCVPDRSAVAEIETSSRLVNDNGVLTLSTPMISRDAQGALKVSPLGFVISPDRFLTIRFAGSVVFDKFADHWRTTAEAGAISGMEPFLGILEAMVDRLADVLEQIGADLDTLSAAVFLRGSGTSGPSRKRDQFLQNTLTDIGQKGEHVSHMRDGLLGVGRIVRFVQETASTWVQETEQRRLKTIERDISSLNDYDAQMTGKIQFLLDATLGFINIEQNNTIKVLTVVSIVGIPPTFVASLYGMNFKNMPELGWTYGYQYGLSLIGLSILVPLVVFWRKGWL